MRTLRKVFLILSDDANPVTATAVELSETVIPASHKLTKMDAKDATCTESGNKEYWTCEHCGKYFLSDDANSETAKAVELSETILPAIQHKNAELRNASEPTETSPGYSGDLYCPDCDKVVEKGYTYWNEDNLTWKLDADGTLTISGTGAMKDYNYHGNRSPVCNNSKVKKIVIEDGVTSIGNDAFYNCTSLTSITIPNSVTSIGAYAFSNCSSLTNITIPNSVTSIENYAFRNCSSLTSITIPDSVTSIGTATFYGCKNLTSITIPDSVTSIGESAFAYCSSLTSITIPDSVTSIGAYAFSNCSSLTNITIPNSVTSIENYAFRNCSSLTSITIPDSVTSIGTATFYGCKNLTSITIPDSVTSIGESAFAYCSSLTSITIPDSVTSIGEAAFSNCWYLTNITIPDSVTSIGEYAFQSCSSLTSITIPDGVTSIGRYAFSGCISLTSITIPDGVTSIGRYAFSGCISLTSITIPDSVTSIGNSAFSNCESLTAISLGCGSALKKSDFGEQANLVSYTNQHALIKTAAKAKTCTEDGNKEYWTCEHCGKYFLSDDTNPETAVELSETVIPASHKLTKVEAKDATCAEDGNKAYWTCEHCGKYFLSDDSNPETATAVELSETVIPALKHKNATTRGVVEPTETAPGYSGDRYCPDCNTVLEKGYTYWNEDNLTWKLDADGTLTISGTGTMKDYDYNNNPSPANQKKGSVKKVVIKDGVTSIGNFAFYNCKSLTSITIPDSVTSIELAAFNNCNNLTSITIPDSVTSIGDSAFELCNKLSSITLSNNITSIENFAFSKCSSLTNITIPDSVTSIGSSAFNGCSSLQTISLSCKSSLKKSDFGDQADLVSYTSHTLKKTEAKDATCTEDGNKEYWTCEHCGKYFLSDDTNPETAKAVEQSETVIPASHKLTKVEAKDATCTEDGNKEYWTCEHCGKYFLSDDTNPETAKAVELSETILPALKHKNETTRDAVEPNGTKPGYSGDRYCPDCDTVLEKGYTYWVEGDLTWKLYEDGTLNISGTGAMKDYSYDSPATRKKDNVKKVVIEDGVTSIGAYAFYNCSSLTDITISGSVTSIGKSAFYNCSSLTDITIPGSVTSIGEIAFSWCSNLTSIEIPSSVTSIGESAFSSTPWLTNKRQENGSLVIVNGILIDGRTCSGEVTIPDGVTNIGNRAFQDCTDLTSVVIPEGVTSIGEFVFQNCTGLTSITIPDGVTSIGMTAFYGCRSLTSINIPEGVTSIGAFAFFECAELTSIKIPSSVTSIGDFAFSGCNNLNEITVPCDSTLTKKAFGDAAEKVTYRHSLVKTDAKDATYTEDGNVEYWTCEHCKKYFLSDDTNAETAKAVELSEIMIPALVQVATATTPIKCVYGQDMNKIDLRDYVKNTDVVGEVTVKVATDSTLPDGMKLDNGKISGKPAKAYEDGKEVTFTFTAENGSTANLTLLFLVAKADPTVEVAVSGDSHTEGDLVSELKLILSENSTKGVVELVSEIKALVAGKNTFTWKFTPEDENNYNMVTGTVVVNAQTTTTTTTTTKATTTTTKATTTTKPSKTTTTKATTTTKPSKTTTTKATTTTKPSKTTTTKITTTTKPNKTTTTKVTTTTKPSKTTTTNATTTTKPSKTTTTKATTTTKPSKTTTTKATTTTKPNKTTTTKATTTTKPSKTTTTKATTTTKPSKTTTTNATTTTKPSKTTTTKITTTTKPNKTTTTKVTTTTKPSKTTTTNATTTNTAIPSYGDVNLDGKVDIVDAIFLNKYLATLIQFSDAQMANADCCQDGVLNDQDTTALMQFIILLIDDLPVQPTEK